MCACEVYWGKGANGSGGWWSYQIDVIVTSFDFAQPLLYKSLSDPEDIQESEIWKSTCPEQIEVLKHCNSCGAEPQKVPVFSPLKVTWDIICTMNLRSSGNYSAFYYEEVVDFDFLHILVQ